VDLYEPALDKWVPSVALPLRLDRMASAVTKTGQLVFVTGGIFAQSGAVSKKCLVFDIRTSKWNSLPNLQQPCFGHAAVMDADGHRLFLMGGLTNETKTVVEEFDLRNPKWRTVNPLSEPRDGLSAVLAPDGLIYAVGGGSKKQLNVTILD